MTAAARIEAIEKSLRVFVCGLLGFIPGLGVIPAVYAVFEGARLYTRHRGDWNPAAAYLNWGMLVALATLGLWFLIAVLILFQIATNP